MIRVLVTGGCGFIGSALVRHLVRDRAACVVNLDALDRAGLGPSFVARAPHAGALAGDR